MRCLELILLLALLLPKHAPASKSDIVKAWARTLGDELWRLNEALTKSDQIRMKYKQMNASVKKKNGKLILDSSLRSVSTMLTRKINAVKCIHATAEKLAKEFNYYNMTKDKTFVNSIEYCDAKYSDFENILASDNNLAPRPELPGFAEDNPNFKPITLEKDSHFYNISVNTNTSCVHVPTNIFYREADAFNAILWTKELNDIFRKNYQSDPSLSWQYFGSSHGILRFYPAMPWNRVKHADTYDCRVKSWYIEAATCSKDVIILFDVSGSMTGFKNYVARITLKSLLETLSNNDYVNVYTFKNTTSVVVTCFSGLVQATQENINTILTTLQPINGTQHRVPLEGNANLTKAYIEAFTTLKEKRVKCNVSSTQGCNQLVMLITDYVPGNLSEVFDEYNREVVGNKTYTPVRVFTYLIGKEVTNVQEIQSMACNNRGYFAHIHSVEEVQQQVLKYINVIARPMILQGEEPPPTWTHANLDETRTKAWNVSGDIDLQDEDKLVTSVAIPAFDYRHNEDNNDAILLGVAGTDVPIDNIAKLAQPHQLGVNGYSFIVSNNGYLLLHPLLIATINRKLQMNYNSIDFVEVEQVDDGKGPRELGDKIKELREHLVNGDDGQMTNVEVLFHYDSMRRISRVKHDYFFNSLSGTPFSMGISLPRVYGDTELLLKDNPLEAKQGKELTGINVTDYFRFSYRVHPDWVYCKYHYLEGHETAYPELEIWGFLVNLSNNEIDITKRQYIEETETEFSVETHCGNATKELGRDSYYCNEDLVKQLVFDAKLSTPYFQDWDASLSDRRLAEVYNVSVRFIATSSGLTRWHYIFDEYKNEWVDETGHRINNFTGEVFGDKNHNSIEETWYKAAVLQAMINKESIVVATPLPVLDETIEDKGYVVKDGDITITASYAIFYKDGESETPASVVGFQYSHSQFHDRFVDIIDNKDLECGENYECFLIDSSGYIVVSVPTNKDLLKTDQVGQFFGAVNRDNALVLQYLVDRTIYDTVEVFNYQALCPLSVLKEPNCAWLLRSPFDITKNFIRWLMTELVLMIMNWNQYAFGLEDPDAATTAVPPSMEKNDTISPEDDEETTFSCDHRISLYILNQRYFTESTGVPRAVFEDDVGACHPPFWAAYVMKTNLLLVVVEKGDWVFNESCPLPPETKPLPTENSTTSREPCHKLDLGALYRRRLEGCYTYHEKEEDIKQCGHGSILTANPVIFFIAVFLASIVNLRPAPGSVT